MQINYLSYSFNTYNNYSYNAPVFGAKGQPISLKYIMEKRSHFLPERVKKYAQELIDRKKDDGVSLLEIHRKIYEPILSCKNLAQIKMDYPEFQDVLPMVPCKNNSVNIESRTIENFGLKVLQEYWGNLRTKDEIAQMLGMKGRGTLDFSLNKINFIGYNHNYRTLLKASDSEGNKVIAGKTKAWNMKNPELRRELNKHAAQGCKTDEYRQAQAQRMYEYDTVHPERRQKISHKSKQMWDRCPDVKAAMCEFGQSQSTYISHILSKRARNQKLSEKERIVLYGFYKKFWSAYPEMKIRLSQALSEVRNNID